ncbi:MAG: formate/nitrite transporter family protein [Alphaproteobacteria bacterium]
MTEPCFEKEELDRIGERRSLRAHEIFEVVRREGDEEMHRPVSSLAWSGLAAGLAIGFSVVAEAAIRARLGADAGWAQLLGDMGYTVGFIIVVVGKLQLFTENTITPVMPFCFAPNRYNFVGLIRIWAIVFSANMVGAFLFALFFMESGTASEAIRMEIISLGHHAAHGSVLDILAGGIGAGFLIASLVWMMAAQKSNAILLIFIITYTIAIAGFSHVVAGAVEMAALWLTGEIGAGAALFGFLLPAFVGNVIGGTLLFTLIAYGQIRREVIE